MADTVVASLGRHGAASLPSVEADSYNLELKDDEGFLGDRASRLLRCARRAGSRGRADALA